MNLVAITERAPREKDTLDGRIPILDVDAHLHRCTF